jgi:glycine cleavage system H lipoate-binding protein
MRCPFLRESWVKSCQASPYKKVIEQTAESAADLCTSSAYTACAAFKPQRGAVPTPPCPFLQESRAHVCSQDPTVRFVPCSDQVLPRCVTGNHRYCENFLAAEHKRQSDRKTREDSLTPMPSHLYHSHNHMWLDVGPEHDCHVGLDALLARLLGRIDKLSFLTSQGEQCPSVILSTHGVQVHMIFPNPMRITAHNAQVSVDPEKIHSGPYGMGWLFEGIEADGRNIRDGLMTGEEARQWMHHEVRRAADLLQRRIPGEAGGKRVLAADGGLPAEGAIKLLRRNEISGFFDELFMNKEAM